MKRRTLVQLGALRALAQTQAPSPKLKLSVRVEPVFPGIQDLSDQMRKVAEAGYSGFEFGHWRNWDPAKVTALARQLKIECACIVGNAGVNPPGMGLCNSRDRVGFLKEIRASVEAAKRFEATRMVVLTGNEVPGLSRQAQHRSIVEGLKLAHEIVAPYGITLILEPLNTLVDHQGYYLNHTAEGFQIMREVDSPFVKILFDIYHVQIMEGNLIETIKKGIAHIAHFHVGDVPGRHEPGTGEINYRNIFRVIRELPFKGYVAMEYRPSKDPMVTLAEVRSIAQG